MSNHIARHKYEVVKHLTAFDPSSNIYDMRDTVLGRRTLNQQQLRILVDFGLGSIVTPLRNILRGGKGPNDP